MRTANIIELFLNSCRTCCSECLVYCLIFRLYRHCFRRNGILCIALRARSFSSVLLFPAIKMRLFSVLAFASSTQAVIHLCEVSLNSLTDFSLTNTARVYRDFLDMNCVVAVSSSPSPTPSPHPMSTLIEALAKVSLQQITKPGF